MHKWDTRLGYLGELFPAQTQYTPSLYGWPAFIVSHFNAADSFPHQRSSHIGTWVCVVWIQRSHCLNCRKVCVYKMSEGHRHSFTDLKRVRSSLQSSTHNSICYITNKQGQHKLNYFAPHVPHIIGCIWSTNPHYTLDWGLWDRQWKPWCMDRPLCYEALRNKTWSG